MNGETGYMGSMKTIWLKMKEMFLGTVLTLFSLMAVADVSRAPVSVIRINQLGYLPQSVKVAVFLSESHIRCKKFKLVDAETGRTVYKGKVQNEDGSLWGFQSACRLDFSEWNLPGNYFLSCTDAVSPIFPVGKDVFRGITSYLLMYMRQQRCGYNPYFRDSCHTHDGFIVDHPTRTGEIIDVKGGWHDATDYLQYTNTSANAVYNLFFSWSEHPEVFNDEFGANGMPGSNHIPDILDEAIWGTEWLLKMNPSFGEMYNQIADDRDHRGFRLPHTDTVSYGNGLYRPVYFVTGKSQGLAKHKNRTTGVSSIAAKFASSFSIASRILRTYNPVLSSILREKALDAYRFALTDLGNTQTACVVSPYFYEEENWLDDMELAAIELFILTGDEKYRKDAVVWGQAEPVTPWMAFNRACHYQYYPFINLGHYLMASQQDSLIRNQFTGYIRDGLEFIRERAAKDPFRIGVPFIWCSNNLVMAAVTQTRMYEEVSGDTRYRELEAAHRDWLFGCNPWGTSMICGLPENGDSPVQPHSSLTYLTGENTTGGLVDGPVYSSIFKNHIGSSAMKEDPYKPFQNGLAVYHDDIGDYSTNEPTMDGTATLSWYFSRLEEDGREKK